MKLDPHVPTFYSGATTIYHFLVEERFNQRLLFDLVARPASSRLPEVA